MSTQNSPNRLPWDDLQIFLSIAQNGSANKAAEELGVSHTTVGRRLKALEDTLGVRLVERNSGSTLALTVEGSTVAAEARRMEEVASSLVRKLNTRDESLTGTIRITITEGIASLWLAGALQPWIAAHPDLRLDWLTTNVSRGDLYRDADIAVWWFRPEDPHLICRRLGTVTYSLYTSQAYIDELGMPQSVDDLGNHRVLHFRGYDIHPGFRNWSALMRRFPPAMTLESTLTAESAMRQGRYIALLPDYVLRIAPEGIRIPIELGIAMDVWLAYHEDRRTQARVRALSAEIIRLADAARGVWFDAE